MALGPEHGAGPEHRSLEYPPRHGSRQDSPPAVNCILVAESEKYTGPPVKIGTELEFISANLYDA
jgi:hypothetical protein